MKEGCVGYFSPRATVNYTPATSVGFLSPFHLSLKLIINYIKIYTYSFNAGFTIHVTTEICRTSFPSPILKNNSKLRGGFTTLVSPQKITGLSINFPSHFWRKGRKVKSTNRNQNLFHLKGIPSE